MGGGSKKEQKTVGDAVDGVEPKRSKQEEEIPALLLSKQIEVIELSDDDKDIADQLLVSMDTGIYKSGVMDGESCNVMDVLLKRNLECLSGFAHCFLLTYLFRS